MVQILLKVLMIVFFYAVTRSLKFAERKTWDDAQQHCLSLGRRLMEVRSQDDNDRAMQIISEPNGINHIWLGGNAIQDDIWIWNSDGERINLDQFWQDGEPNSSHEDCLEIRSMGLMMLVVQCAVAHRRS